MNPDLKPIESFSTPVIHGTFKKCWPQIKSSGGLSRMNRNHIHFSKGLPDDEQVISGMRRDCHIHIYVDTQKALEGLNKLTACNGIVKTLQFDSGLDFVSWSLIWPKTCRHWWIVLNTWVSSNLAPISMFFFSILLFLKKSWWTISSRWQDGEREGEGQGAQRDPLYGQDRRIMILSNSSSF